MLLARGLLRVAAPLSTRVRCYRYCSRLFCSEQKRQEKAARKAQEKAEKEAARLASAKDQVFINKMIIIVGLILYTRKLKIWPVIYTLCYKYYVYAIWYIFL